LGTKESAEGIMSKLLRGNATVVLDIQKQLVDDGLILGETPVGRYAQQDMLKQHQKYVEELRDPEKVLQEAQQNKDKSTLSQRLEIGRQGLNMKLDQLAECKNPEYASLLESDRSKEDEGEAQTSKLKKEIQKQDKQLHELMLELNDEQSRASAISDHRIQQTRFEIQGHEEAPRRDWDVRRLAQILRGWFVCVRKYIRAEPPENLEAGSGFILRKPEGRTFYQFV
jgi:hypothetical protein